jgi:molecular chaperone GrpE (heat shock protein)
LESCHYDLEPNQSRVAAYKQKIEQQLSSIKRLEDEIQELKKSPFSSGSLVRETASEPAPSSSNNSSGGVPMRLLLNPAPEPSASPSQTLSNTTGLYVPASHHTTQTFNREAELLNYQRNLEAEMRKLKDENRTLQALISILNSMDDREQAQKMAQEIYTRGVSDDLLSKAQHLMANQVRRPLVLNLQTQAKAPQRLGRAAENSQWSTP